MSTIELLTWEGCPSTMEAVALCKKAATELGLSLEIEQREINTFELAQREKFVGSPTFRIGGNDLFEDSKGHFGLGCRVYTKPNGKFGPLPEYEEFKTKLKVALT